MVIVGLGLFMVIMVIGWVIVVMSCKSYISKTLGMYELGVIWL
jgi:hypothetical protein